jgi:23S rRNA (guanosine2251-2'-O)-methyltransferase
MPTNRPPRGGKPTSGRAERSPAAGPRKGSRTESARPGRAEGPARGRGEGPARGRSEGPARGRAEGGPRGRAEGPARGRSEGPSRGRSEGARAEGRPPRGAKPAFGRTERPARAPREERAPRLDDRATRPASDDLEESFDEESIRDIVFGRHPVMAVLEGDKPINKVWILKTLQNPQIVAKVKELAKEKGATVQMVERAKLDALTLDQNHQGLVVSIAAGSYIDLDEIIEKAKASPYPALLMADGIEDPHNLGALIRTAEGAGFAGVIIPSRRAVGLTPTVHKASAGSLARMPICRVGNLSQAVETLHAAGFWLAGADARGKSLPYEIDMTVPLVVVIGAEGKGLSKLLGDKCDWLVHLPLGGELESLNASVAGGVLMYEAVRQRWAKDQAAAAAGPELAGG